MANARKARLGADPREIARAHATFLSTGALDAAAARIREVVAGSWLRSSRAHVDPDADPPVTLLDGDLAGYRAAHPLAAVVPVLRDLVGGTADDSEHLWAIMDADGRLLWVEGHRGARARAARMNFVEGALWDEAHAGTNAPGTALALNHEVQIFAAEHFRHTAQAWTCAAAPIRDPVTGRILGVLDVTGGDAVAHPHSLALVRAAAQVAEGQLALHAPKPTATRLLVLGRPDGVLVLDGCPIPLHRRHAELMAVLAAHPEGLTGHQLAAAIYADDAAETTLRVELTRLRQIAGDLLCSRPYRLAGPIGADFLDVARALEHGDVAAAIQAYAGPLLPTSDAPAVVERRHRLELSLRSAVLTSRDPQTTYAWASRAGFDDLAVWEHLARLAPRHEAAGQRVRELRAEYGLPIHATFM
jgi:hypothetical protein